MQGMKVYRVLIQNSSSFIFVYDISRLFKLSKSHQHWCLGLLFRQHKTNSFFFATQLWSVPQAFESLDNPVVCEERRKHNFLLSFYNFPPKQVKTREIVTNFSFLWHKKCFLLRRRPNLQQKINELFCVYLWSFSVSHSSSPIASASWALVSTLRLPVIDVVQRKGLRRVGARNKSE